MPPPPRCPPPALTHTRASLLVASPVGSVPLPALFFPCSLPDHQSWSLKSSRSLEPEPLAFLPPHTRSRTKVGAAGPRRGHYRPFIVSALRSSFCSPWKQRRRARAQPRLCERKHSAVVAPSQTHIPLFPRDAVPFCFPFPAPLGPAGAPSRGVWRDGAPAGGCRPRSRWRKACRGQAGRVRLGLPLPSLNL